MLLLRLDVVDLVCVVAELLLFSGVWMFKMSWQSLPGLVALESQEASALVFVRRLPMTFVLEVGHLDLSLAKV